MISSNTLNWNAAKSACEALGSTLAMIKSQAEQQALGPKLPRRTWIGLHRNPKEKSRWLWVDGTQATYFAWSNNEPNNVVEECAEIIPERTWKWNDHMCSYAANYVCETKGGLKNIMLTVNKNPFYNCVLSDWPFRWKRSPS